MVETEHHDGPSAGGIRHHAVIAGTGRAGTSFLVRFLDRCGLETNLAASSWFPQARAGYEHALDAEGQLPYVVKDPVLFTYCTELDLSTFHIDALVVPVRDLMLAAQSRVHQERLALADNPWLRHRNIQYAGATPGGILYSLDVLDQAKTLAVGFHKLVHWALANELPLFLPEFPRMVEDRDYALDVLWPWLSGHCTRETAHTAFAETADADAVRIKAGSPDQQCQQDNQALLSRLETQRLRIEELEAQLAARQRPPR